jgi:hypothetical protein
MKYVYLIKRQTKNFILLKIEKILMYVKIHGTLTMVKQNQLVQMVGI